jgi:Xaa-Pro aminopeptidase
MTASIGDGIPFSAEEFGGRLERVRAAMADGGIDTLIVTDPSNIYYLTGYEAWSFYVQQMLVVHQDMAEPIWIGRYMDAVTVHRTTRLSADHIRPYGDEYVQSADRSPADFMARVMIAQLPRLRRIGVEMGAFYYTAAFHRSLVASLADAEFVDADLLINWVRAVKSPSEVAMMRDAGRISDAIMARIASMIRPGMRECDVASAVYAQMIEGVPDCGGVYATSPPHMGVAERSVEPHAIWSDRVLKRGMPVNLETSGCRRRYHAPISRTFYLGPPPDAYRRLADAVIEGLEETLAAIRPGLLCEDVETVWQRAIARHGFHKEARLGYSIGIGFPPTWGERSASLRPGDRTELRPGMAFHMMSGLWLEPAGVTITQSFVVTESGHEPLTRTPRELFVKE